MATKDRKWLEQRGPIWLGRSIQLGHTTKLGDLTRLGNTIELDALLDLIDERLSEFAAQDNGHSGTVLLNYVADRLLDPVDKAAYLAAANERFIGD